MIEIKARQRVSHGVGMTAVAATVVLAGLARLIGSEELTLTAAVLQSCAAAALPWAVVGLVAGIRDGKRGGRGRGGDAVGRG